MHYNTCNNMYQFYILYIHIIVDRPSVVDFFFFSIYNAFRVNFLNLALPKNI